MNKNSYDNILKTEHTVIVDNVVTIKPGYVIPNFKANNMRILREVIMCLRGKSDDNQQYFNMLTYSYLNWIPDYFFYMPAASTGKYHPAFANRKNGLVLHSLAVVRYTRDMMNIYDDYIPSDAVYNNMICAAWLHDIFKYGDPAGFTKSTFTDHAHPIYASKFFVYPEVIRKAQKFGIHPNDLDMISKLIETHMGPYVTSRHSDVVLTPPSTSLQKLLFQADYYASRRENDIVMV